MHKQIWPRIKPYFRWVALGGALLFLAKAIKEHASEAVGIKIDASGWAALAIALGVTMLAHIWSGWVWTWILRELNQPVTSSKLVQVYLQTNIAKYVPGNFWHYYGRILGAKTAGIEKSAATLSVLLEPLLMAAAALTSVLLTSLLIKINNYITLQGLAILGLIAVLIAVHPRFLNAAVRSLGSFKAKATDSTTVRTETVRVIHYPLRPLLGELGFLGLRSTGFLLTLLAFNCLELSQMPLLLEAFSLAWLLGLIVPTPGGLGVFEATAIALLHHLSPARLLSAIALYRLISILAEAACAGLAWLDERRMGKEF